MILKFSSPALSSLLNYKLYLNACLHLCIDSLVSSKLPSWAFILLTCSLFSLFCFRKWQLCCSSFSGHTWHHPWPLSFSPSHFPSLNKSFGLYFQSICRIRQFFTTSTTSLFWCLCAQLKLGGTIIMEQKEKIDWATTGSLRYSLPVWPCSICTYFSSLVQSISPR